MQASFRPGHILVANNPLADNNELFTIERIGRNGCVFDTRWRLLDISLFRHATPQEIKLGHRI